MKHFNNNIKWLTSPTLKKYTTNITLTFNIKIIKQIMCCLLKLTLKINMYIYSLQSLREAAKKSYFLNGSAIKSGNGLAIKKKVFENFPTTIKLEGGGP